MGHISPGRGLVVHMENCKNLNDIRLNPEKCIPLNWSPSVDGEFTTEIKVEVAAERGIIAILASRVTEQNATIEQIRVNERDAHTNIVALTLKVKNRVHLANIMRRIRTLKPAQKVYRIKN